MLNYEIENHVINLLMRETPLEILQIFTMLEELRESEKWTKIVAKASYGRYTIQVAKKENEKMIEILQQSNNYNIEKFIKYRFQDVVIAITTE